MICQWRTGIIPGKSIPSCLVRLRLKHNKRGHQPGDGSKKGAKRQKTGDGKPGQLSKRTIMAIAKQLQALNVEADASESEQSEAEMATQKTSNRTNKALQRRKL